MNGSAAVTDVLASLTLFADLSPPQLEEVAHTFEEETFDEGARVLRRGFSGGGFYVILAGDASVMLEGEEIDRLHRGDFFGEISALTDETPSADIVATRTLHCLVLAGVDLQDFLLTHPTVSYRMLQTEARRLRRNTQWKA